MTPDLPRVLLVDDNQEILDRAAAILSRDCTIVGAVKDGPAAIDATVTLRPDLVVLDLSMPGMNGFEVAGRLRAIGCAAPIVFLSVHGDADFVQAATAAGAIGYVVKSRLATDLVTAVTEAHAGRPYVSRMA
jgi:DNA-binding NarL/FixJ family response regulator